MSPADKNSATLTERQLVLVSRIGSKIIGFFAVVPETLLYGIYIAVMILCIMVHLQKGSMSRPALIVLLVTIAMFLSTTVQFWLNFSSLMKQTQAMLVNPTQPNLKLRLAILGELTIPYNEAENWFSTFNFICSDIVVMWRAWALCQDRRALIIIPGVFLLGTIVSGVIFAGIGMKAADPKTSPDSYMIIWGLSQLGHHIFSLLTNISATVLVCWKAWTHRRYSHASNGYRLRTYGTERIMTLLVESGIIYCVLQAVLVALLLTFRFSSAESATLPSALASYYGCLFIISGLYPTVIVVIVSMQRSIEDNLTIQSTPSGPKEVETPYLDVTFDVKSLHYQSGLSMASTPRLISS